MKIKTNSLEPGEPKSSEDCLLFDIYKSFASDSQISSMKRISKMEYLGGMQNELYELLDEQLSTHRLRYDELMSDPSYLDKSQEGAERAREVAN